jgi:hypothetical protein
VEPRTPASEPEPRAKIPRSTGRDPVVTRSASGPVQGPLRDQAPRSACVQGVKPITSLIGHPVLLLTVRRRWIIPGSHTRQIRHLTAAPRARAPAAQRSERSLCPRPERARSDRNHPRGPRGTRFAGGNRLDAPPRRGPPGGARFAGGPRGTASPEGPEEPPHRREPPEGHRFTGGPRRGLLHREGPPYRRGLLGQRAASPDPRGPGAPGRRLLGPLQSAVGQHHEPSPYRTVRKSAQIGNQRAPSARHRYVSTAAGSWRDGESWSRWVGPGWREVQGLVSNSGRT